MSIVDQDRATEDLQSHFHALDDMVRGAWGDVQGLPSFFQVTMSARSRASLVHDCFLTRASAYADSTPGVRYFKRNLMHGLVFDGRYAIRFKKFDEDNRSKNQPTVQVTEFRGQIELDGIDAAHHLELGYVVDSLGIDVVDVRVTCPAGEGNAWAISISHRGSATVLADLFPASGGGADEVEPAEIEPRQTGGEVIRFPGKTD
jgi:hypothetical protein